MPWKNGGGETIEIAVAPDKASLETFDWRISRALIRSHGPFSSFPGVDRTIVAIEGAGIFLHFDNTEPLRLSPGDSPLPFAGEMNVESRMIGGEVMDLNVMTRRGRFRHRLRTLEIDRPFEIATPVNGVTAIVAAESVVVQKGEIEIALQRNDAALFDVTDGAIALRPEYPCRIFLIEIEAL
jgi:environmental stress-induced protein Ves